MYSCGGIVCQRRLKGDGNNDGTGRTPIHQVLCGRPKLVRYRAGNGPSWYTIDEHKAKIYLYTP